MSYRSKLSRTGERVGNPRFSRKEGSPRTQTTPLCLWRTWIGRILSRSGMQADLCWCNSTGSHMGMLAVDNGLEDHPGSQSTWKGWDGLKAASPDQVQLLASDM